MKYYYIMGECDRGSNEHIAQGYVTADSEKEGLLKLLRKHFGPEVIAEGDLQFEEWHEKEDNCETYANDSGYYCYVGEKSAVLALDAKYAATERDVE